LAIFVPDTLDFWVAVDPPPASRGRWVGFNLKKELDGSGSEPDPSIIPAMSEITTAYVRINKDEPWTGKWNVESTDISYTLEMNPDATSFKGTLVLWGRSYQLKGHRIE
jgi:hypothetical protein